MKIILWIVKIKKFSQSLEIFLQYFEMCSADIKKIWEPIHKKETLTNKKQNEDISNSISTDFDTN